MRHRKNPGIKTASFLNRNKSPKLGQKQVYLLVQLVFIRISNKQTNKMFKKDDSFLILAHNADGQIKTVKPKTISTRGKYIYKNEKTQKQSQRRKIIRIQV